MELFGHTNKYLYTPKVMSRCYSLCANMVAALFVAITTACNSKSSANTGNGPDTDNSDSMAVAYYTMQVNGQYNEYIGAMQSCDGMPSDYKNNIVAMLRHHNQDIKKEKLGVKRVAVLRSEMHNSDQLANVFLNVTYNDGSQEEVMVTLVHDNNIWRMQ